MTLPWFRLYAEFASDAKVQILAFEDQRHFVVLLCLKCNNTLDGDAPSEAYRERLIAKALGLDPATSLEVKRRLIEAGLIDRTWQPIKWDERQFASDYSTSRVHKFREKQKRNVSETLQERSETVIDQSQNRSDTDQIQRKTKRSNSASSHSAPAEDVRQVFEHWCSTWNHQNSALDAKRTALIQKALKGNSAQRLCESISGYKNSPHHTGINDRNTVYDGLHLLLRDQDHIDAGVRFLENPPSLRSEKTEKNLRVLSNWRPPGWDYEAERLSKISGDDGDLGIGVQSGGGGGTGVHLLGRAKGSGH